jgi:hypothetical protein
MSTSREGDGLEQRTMGGFEFGCHAVACTKKRRREQGSRRR